MQENIIIDGKILLAIIVLILLLFDLFVKIINIWLENNMLKQRFNYKKETEDELYNYINKVIKNVLEAIEKPIKHSMKKISRLKRKITGRTIMQE